MKHKRKPIQEYHNRFPNMPANKSKIDDSKFYELALADYVEMKMQIIDNIRGRMKPMILYGMDMGVIDDPEPEATPVPEPVKKRKEFIYRVECEDGMGMYSSHNSPALPIGDGNSQHPTPYGDQLLSPIWSKMTYAEHEHYFFGFSSMEQLRRWVSNIHWCKQAHDYGLRICIYQTDDYHIGDTQMIFRKATATFVGKADLI